MELAPVISRICQNLIIDKPNYRDLVSQYTSSQRALVLSLNQLLSTCDDSIRSLRNQVLLRIGYETMRRRSELCAFKFEDICMGANGKPPIRLNFSKTHQLGTDKILPISQELFDLSEKWRCIISDEGYILRSIDRHGHIGSNLHPASISNLLKALQKSLKMNSDEQTISGHSFFGVEQLLIY